MKATREQKYELERQKKGMAMLDKEIETVEKQDDELLSSRKPIPYGEFCQQYGWFDVSKEYCEQRENIFKEEHYVKLLNLLGQMQTLQDVLSKRLEAIIDEWTNKEGMSDAIDSYNKVEKQIRVQKRDLSEQNYPLEHKEFCEKYGGFNETEEYCQQRENFFNKEEYTYVIEVLEQRRIFKEVLDYWQMRRIIFKNGFYNLEAEEIFEDGSLCEAGEHQCLFEI